MRTRDYAFTYRETYEDGHVWQYPVPDVRAATLYSALRRIARVLPGFPLAGHGAVIKAELIVTP